MDGTRRFRIIERGCRDGGTSGPRSGDRDIAAFAALSSDSLAEATRPLLPAASDAAHPGPGPARPWNAADLLALGLDLGGALELDAWLCREPCGESPQAPPASPPDAERRAAGAALSSELQLRFERLASPLRRRLKEVASGRSRIPLAAELHTALALRGLLAGRPNAAALRAAARAASEPYLLVVASCIERIRGEARALRSELAPSIAALGRQAARIEALDAVIGRARARFVRQLLARIPPALALRFEADLQEALRSLEPGPEVQALAGWYEDTGWLSRFESTATGIVVALLEHERAALAGLVAAALEAEGLGRD